MKCCMSVLFLYFSKIKYVCRRKNLQCSTLLFHKYTVLNCCK
nr:MAG TPA: hypothetical protein [Caudoviricetes sp.]